MSSPTNNTATKKKSALIIVDFQNDFCPPTGSLAVPLGRSIASTINLLLSFPDLDLRIATKDWHPTSHISFASNHSPPDNIPFVSEIEIANPGNPGEVVKTRLWPVHCVQGTPGAELVEELDVGALDYVIEKGGDERVEMYSAFRPPFRSPALEEADSGLAGLLRGEGIERVFVVGLAYDYCVKCTAVDAAREGFETFVVREGCRGVDDGEETERRVRGELEREGVRVVGMEGEEVGSLRG